MKIYDRILLKIMARMLHLSKLTSMSGKDMMDFQVDMGEITPEIKLVLGNTLNN